MTERIAVEWTPRHGAPQRLQIVEDAGGLGLVREQIGITVSPWTPVVTPGGPANSDLVVRGQCGTNESILWAASSPRDEPFKLCELHSDSAGMSG